MEYQKLVKERTFRNQRSRLKKRIRNGAHISNKIRKYYNLTSEQKKYYIKIINNPKFRKKYDIVVPSVFSFSKNPDESLRFLSNIQKDFSNNNIAYDLYIDHTNTYDISISASFLFDKIINEYVKKWKRSRIKIILSGKCSRSRSVNNFLLSFGLFSYINIIAKQICPSDADLDYKKQFILFKKYGNKTKDYISSNASTELTDFFEKCFNDNGFSIIEETKGELIGIFAEIINNAEEHSGSNKGEWNVIGCYSKKSHKCSFSIINFGQSFYESLKSVNSTASDALSSIDDIILKHARKLDKTFDKKRYEEKIWTMMALQDGISSKRTSQGTANTRGQGIMDVVSFIDIIRNRNKNNSMLSIISGYTNILIDYKYPVKEKKVDNTNEKRRYMIFNEGQNLHEPPNNNYIRSMNEDFNGVIFSGEFIIDEKYLTDKINEGKNE